MFFYIYKTLRTAKKTTLILGVVRIAVRVKRLCVQFKILEIRLGRRAERKSEERDGESRARGPDAVAGGLSAVV